MPRESNNSYPAEELLGKTVYAIVSQPDRIESYLIHKEAGKCIILSTGPVLNDEQKLHLIQIISDKNSYHFCIKRCFPNLTKFALRFRKGKATVEVVIDLHCAIWRFRNVDAKFDGKRDSTDCDPVNRELINLMKILFPEYASQWRGSLWKQGIIKQLLEKAHDGKKA